MGKAENRNVGGRREAWGLRKTISASAVLGFDFPAGGIHACANQKLLGRGLGRGDFSRGFPDAPDFAFRILLFDVVLNDVHGVNYRR
jgi:hypothetical protein